MTIFPLFALTSDVMKFCVTSLKLFDDGVGVVIPSMEDCS